MNYPTLSPPCPTLLPSHLISSPLLSPTLSYSLLPFNPFLSLPYPHISFAPSLPTTILYTPLAYHTIPSVPFPMLPALSSQVPPPLSYLSSPRLASPLPLFPSPRLPSPLLSSPPFLPPSPLLPPAPLLGYSTLPTLPSLPSLSYSTPPPLPSHRLPSPPFIPLPFPTRSHTLPYPFTPHSTSHSHLPDPSLLSPTLPFTLRYATVSSPPLRYLRCLSVCLSVCTHTNTCRFGRQKDGQRHRQRACTRRQTNGRTD